MKVFLSYTREELAGYYSERGLALLRDHVDLVFNETGRVLRGRELAEAAQACRIILAHRSTPGDAETFHASPGLVAFLRGAVDISTIDVAAASACGVLVTHATAGFGTAVAELALGMIFDLARGISRARHLYAGTDDPVLPKGLQVRGSTVGIVGYGTIGRQLAAMCKALDCKVLVSDPHSSIAEPGIEHCTLDELLPRADFVVCLAPSIPQTRNMVDASFLRAMKEGACFLNLSRGELVDDDALEQALDSGRLRGAGLDVGTAKDQKPAARFLRRPDVVAMPHVGGMTGPAREHQTMDTVRQVIALAQGREPEHMVNAAQAHRLRPFLDSRRQP
ncbi:hydroxyacid dehydrogenase [Ramlibacter sp. MAH-25]|uniref:Hydroxyacid dehydrogenase n=1 Tax=Ramlibacter pinisoli TaxID=2682844 RepID=A0A6N8IZN3_9BURK|nr:hydroxyacid dehydrogenase [Ramlibacter sp. CGMCC 1.13660]MVQ32297.1 hydroxyacid dehydrogenase [Ramlibacter pinisoli]